MEKNSAPTVIPYALCEGAGNTILIVDAYRLGEDKTEKIKKVKQLLSGKNSKQIEADQLLEVFSHWPVDFLVWNKDGSNSEMCGNGARAILYFAEKRNWFPALPKAGKSIPMKISGADYSATRLDKEAQFSINFGPPRYESFDIVPIADQDIPVHKVKVGNPHSVVFCGNGKGEWCIPDDFRLREWGPRLSQSLRANVEFVHTKRDGGKQNYAETSVLVWELGSGPTKSCGSGAVAVATVARRLNKDPSITQFDIEMSGGTLSVVFNKNNEADLSGPTAILDEGQTKLSATDSAVSEL